MAEQHEPLDVAIVGGGICGVIALHYARRAGLNAHVFERQSGVGGLWRQLPPWQDIQIGTSDWALGDLAVESPFQPDILKNIEAWVGRFDLSGGISLDCPVQSVSPVDGAWKVVTPGRTVLARHLIAATGAHNRPRVPPVRRDSVTLREYHSSALRDPSELKGRRVLVVGGGASAFDLLDLALEHGARSVAWAHHGEVRWFTPARKPKHVVGSVREYGRMQMSGAKPHQINAGLDADLRGRYEKFGLQAILPRAPVDLQRQQLVPGRPRMVARFEAIRRVQASVEAIVGDTVMLSDGSSLEVDLVLWGTGYEVDLSYFDDAELAAVRTVDDLNERCGGLCLSRKHPNLYFPAVGLDGIGTATWLYAIAMRSLMAHIRGDARLDNESVGHRLNHFDIVQYLAPRDPVNFPQATWKAEYRALADTPDGQPFPIP